MKKLNYLFTVLIIITFYLNIKADEGMWIPLLLEQLNEAEMQSMGMKLSAEDIYSINHSSLKDAIVIFGNGCTAEIISDEGLLLTNHHCGYGLIQKHSSLEHNYLTDGFWAMNRSEELQNPGLTATLLIRMKDVSEEVLDGINDNMTEAVRDSIINKHIIEIKEEAIDTTHYKAYVKPFYYGNKYYLFVTEVFKDIRLVGAPPSNIGKFGGDTDNWMWPRHTGDFSVFRIYADKDNNPAKYSEDNIPYKPKKHIPISLKGVDKGDFTFVFGYPARTQEYIPSYGVEMVTEIINPIKINLREKRLNIIEAAMNESKLVRIQYSAKSASIANGWKKWIGENKGIKRINTIIKKHQLETEFTNWANSSETKNKKYCNLIDSFKIVYTELIPLNISLTYLLESGLSIEIIRYARNFINLINISKNKSTEKEEIDKAVEQLKIITKSYFKNYYQPIDKKTFITLLNIYNNNINKDDLPEIIKSIDKKYNGDFSVYADYVFKKSFMTSEEKMDNFLNNYTKSKYKKIEKDPAYKLASGIINHYIQNIMPYTSVLNNKLDSLQRIYMKGLMEMQPEKRFYPDANFTLRIAYGNVDDYYPRNAVHYDYYTTLDGILQKEDPDIYDYVVEDKLKQLYNNNDYGRYADKDGKMHVCFTATNHTTGGNSGSPVLNAEGQLIGINFDRNWEGTMSDIIYDPEQCRNITLDIRYCLFIIDKFAGAKHLIDEMTIIE
ncbi:MAG: S46 family peptidase [Bacteroidales bacterium]|nr:S46 family peptidase [Bacteroidales bacterium]